MSVECTRRLYQFWNSKKVIVPNRIHCVISLSHRLHVKHICMYIFDVHTVCIVSVRIILCHYGGLMMSIYGKVKHLSPSTKVFVRYRQRRQHISPREYGKTVNLFYYNWGESLTHLRATASHIYDTPTITGLIRSSQLDREQSGPGRKSILNCVYLCTYVEKQHTHSHLYK